MEYDVLIVTNLPNYYKINLLNRVAERRKLFIVFIASSESRRNDDFLSIGEDEKFDYVVLSPSLEHRNYFKTCIKLRQIIKSHTFSKLILGEWVNIEYWFALLFFKKENTSICCMCLHLQRYTLHSRDSPCSTSIDPSRLTSSLCNIFPTLANGVSSVMAVNT